METIPKYDYMIEKLRNGEEVKCCKCKKGVYKPINAAAKINNWFQCNYCGDHYHYEPVVEVK
jgi:hypothetical protein|nr:MAG TPA_asm: hypothetical protein [Caudoviricetes sp.]